MNYAIPPSILGASLWRRGGYALLDDDAVSPALLNGLLEDALARFPEASETRIEVSDDEETRGGSPRRRFLSAGGGDIQRRWYLGSLARLVGKAAGVNLTPAGQGGTYSYYARPGDHIAIHRDIETCDLTLVTCLHHDDGDGNAGNLCFWPTRATEPLSVLRADPAPGIELLRLAAGQSAILFGGFLPHAVLPVKPEQVRIVSILCFRAL
jgi:hypothetical protein